MSPDLLVASRERIAGEPEARKAKARKRGDASSDPDDDTGEKSSSEPQAI